jgi:hypothetical protein
LRLSSHAWGWGLTLTYSGHPLPHLPCSLHSILLHSALFRTSFSDKHFKLVSSSLRAEEFDLEALGLASRDGLLSALCYLLFALCSPLLPYILQPTRAYMHADLMSLGLPYAAAVLLGRGLSEVAEARAGWLAKLVGARAIGLVEGGGEEGVEVQGAGGSVDAIPEPAFAVGARGVLKVTLL